MKKLDWVIGHAGKKMQLNEKGIKKLTLTFTRSICPITHFEIILGGFYTKQTCLWYVAAFF
jgi:hypothetical protein